MHRHQPQLISTVVAVAVIVGLGACKKAPRSSSDTDPLATMAPDRRPPPRTTAAPDRRPAPRITMAPDRRPAPPPAHRVSVTAPDRAAVATASSQFALDLYGRLRGKLGNLFLSPWSITTALGMTYAGAKGRTASEMAKALRFELPQPRLHPAIGAIQSSLAATRGYDLAIANRIYPQHGLGLLPAFVKLLRTSYGSTVQSLDFNGKPGPSRAIINAWVKQQTRGRIPALLKAPDIKSTTRMVLVNAIYFKGKWSRQFDKKLTRPLDFHAAPGRVIKTPMMFQQGTFGYRTVADVDVLSLPYVGKRLAMVVLLPKKKDGLAALEKGLTAKRLTALVGNVSNRKVKVFLPRFKLAARFDLKAQLEALGMPVAFSDGADFSGMEPKRRLKISKVVHQANCDVTEEGTVAAAATAVTMGRRGVSRAPVIPVFRADHPFLFLIRDQQTGVILFMGRFAQPK